MGQIQVNPRFFGPGRIIVVDGQIASDPACYCRFVIDDPFDQILCLNCMPLEIEADFSGIVNGTGSDCGDLNGPVIIGWLVANVWKAGQFNASLTKSGSDFIFEVLIFAATEYAITFRKNFGTTAPDCVLDFVDLDVPLVSSVGPVCDGSSATVIVNAI